MVRTRAVPCASKWTLEKLNLITIMILLMIVLPRPLGETVHARSIHADPWFTLTVEPMTESVQTTRSDDGAVFVVSEAHTYAAWRFIYQVENRSPNETMRVLSVFDSFGEELEILDVGAFYSPGVNPGLVNVWSEGASNSYSFKWEGFELKPREWAQLVIDVGLGKDAAGNQHDASCGHYQLNARGTLRYALGGLPGVTERQGQSYQAEIPCPSFLGIKLDTKVTWMLRMPGDYYARAIEATVTASHPVYVTFSGFDVLKSASNDQTLPVFYALNEERPQGWLTPDQLNATTLLLPTENSALNWNLWQRVVLDGQSAGTYTDTGVITFTLRNVEDAQF